MISQLSAVDYMKVWKDAIQILFFLTVEQLIYSR